MNDQAYSLYFESALNDAEAKELEVLFETAVRENYFFRDNFIAPYISPTLAKKEVRDKLFQFTGEFLDTHSKQLNTSGPVYSFTFQDKEVSFLHELFNITPEQLWELTVEMFKKTYDYDTVPHVIKSCPHNVLIVGIFIEALQKNYEETAKCCEYLLAFSIYPLIYRRYWPTGVQEDVMKYTIEHLPNRFKVTKTGTLITLLLYDVGTAIKLFQKKLKKGEDAVYTSFLYSVRTRINATFRNISKKYYENNVANNSQHTKSGKMDDGNLAVTDGHATNMASVIENTYNKFSIGDINTPLMQVAAESTQVDEATLTNFFNQVLNSKENRLYRLIENIITAYFSKNSTSTSVGGSEFLNFGLGLYRSIATSKDTLYKEIREILNFWMHDIIQITKYYTREGTITNYTRGLFNYIILMIVHHN